MRICAVGAHELLLTVAGDVTLLQTVHAARFGLPAVFCPLVEASIENLLFDGELCLSRICKANANGRVRSPPLDSIRADPLYKGRCWGQGVGIHRN